MNGGYILIDAAGVNLAAESSATVSGLFEELKRAYDLKKPVILNNVEVVDGKIISPTPAGVYEYEGDMIAVVFSAMITVTSEDSVTITTAS